MIGAGSEIGGRFTVLGVIGEGGIATVYRVRHTSLQSDHALKLLHLQKGDTTRRLLIEGRIQARLRHPNVVAVTDVVDVDGATGLVMEFVDGSSLREVLGPGAGLAREEALALFAQILAGVASAHRAGVLHRDLKPANILLSVTNRGVIAKVTDFGIAKVAADCDDPASTRAGSIMGTPGYMAPEQIEDSTRVDRRSDIFALGAILYEMLTGRCPFLRGELFATLDATRRGDYEPLGSAVADCPLEIEAAVAEALQLAPDARFSSCEDFAEALFGVGFELDAGTFTAGVMPTMTTSTTTETRARVTSPTLAPTDFGALRHTLHLLRAQQDGAVIEEVFADPPSVAPPDPPPRRRTVPPPKKHKLDDHLDAFPKEKRASKDQEKMPGLAIPPGGDANAAIARGAWLLARGAGFVARYVAGPVALVFFFTYRQASEGRDLVESVRIERQLAQVDLYNQMDRQLQIAAKLHDAGGRADVLAPHVATFQAADGTEERIAAGRKLLVQMQREMATLHPAFEQAEVIQRRALEREMNLLSGIYDTYAVRESAWADALDTPKARLAERLGMASAVTDLEE